MNRIVLRQPISEALALLPTGIRERVHCEFLTGCDPVFVGLHRHTDTGDGRHYKDTAHATWTCHQGHMPKDRRAPTVVLPYNARPWTVGTIIHELGHVLDESLDFARHTPEPVSRYGETNSWEAFAEAFSLWVCPDLFTEMGGYRPEVLREDHRTLRLLEELAV